MSRTIRTMLQGVRAVFPLLIGGVPFGVIYGAAALRAGLSPELAQSMSSIVFAGTAQFITAELIHDAAPGFVIVMTIVIVNLRHMLYSASVAPFVRHLSLRWKVLLSYLLTDEAYAATMVQYDKVGVTPLGHWFFLGAGLSLWLEWQLSTAAGIFLGTAIPESWPLDFALPLTFIAMLVPLLRSKPSVAVALSAAAVAVLGSGLPYKLGLILAALVGITVGALLERRT